MDSSIPSAHPATTLPAASLPRRAPVTIKLLLIASLVLLLQVPILLLGNLRAQRVREHQAAIAAATARTGSEPPIVEGYRMVDRSLKYAVLVITLVFSAFFLFETLIRVPLHLVHYGLVGAALCLFYLALLTLGEILHPKSAYIGASLASSLLIVCYSAAVLRAWSRASVIAGLLTLVHSVLYIVLRMESYALLAGTTTLFVALGAIMYFTRHVDWNDADSMRPAPRPTA